MKRSQNYLKARMNMKMKKHILSLIVFLPLFLLLYTSVSNAQLLDLPEVRQEQYNWCWAAVSKAILDYYGVTNPSTGVKYSQCEIAEWARVQPGPTDFGDTDCCEEAGDPGSGCNQTNYMTLGDGSIDDILAILGGIESRQSPWPNNVIDEAQVQTEIDSFRPFIMFGRKYRYNEDGVERFNHFMVCHGYTVENGVTVVHYLDPFFDGGFDSFEYSSDGKSYNENGDLDWEWIDTLVLTGCPSDTYTAISPSDMTGLRSFDGGATVHLLSFSAVKQTEDRTIAHFDISRLPEAVPFTRLDIPVSNIDDGPPEGTFEVYVFYGDGVVSIDEWHDGELFHTFMDIPGGKQTLSVDVTRKVQEAVDTDQHFLSFSFRVGSGTDRYWLSSIVGLSDATLQVCGEHECTLHPERFEQATLDEGVEYYTDRSYTLISLPSQYIGMDMIKTPNSDKNNTDESGYLTFEMPCDSTVYVAFDIRATSIPNWMSGFTDTGDEIYTDDVALRVYEKSYSAGECVDLGGNSAPGSVGAGSNYIVFYTCNPEDGQDDHGHGEDGATRVTINSTTRGSIETGGDYDWFVVEVPSSGTLTIYTEGNTDTYGYWRKSGINTIYQDDNSQDGLNFRFDIEDASAGTYYIAVSHASENGTGDYTLHVEFSPSNGGDDHGQGENGATRVTINSTTRGSIETGGDYDWFVVDVPSTGTLTIYTEGNTDTYGYWRKSGTNTIYEDDDSGDGGNFRFDIEDASAGTYYIAVSHATPDGTGKYQLRVEFMELSGDDHGDWFDSATSVAINSTTSGIIETGGDYDFFVVKVRFSGTLTVYTKGITDTYGYLRKSTSSTMYEDNDSGKGNNFRIKLEKASAGTYYIAVRHSSVRKTGKYQLRVEFSAG